MAMSPFVQVPADTSQVYPDGQQFSPLEQQTAFGRGQHPHCPLDSLQHVFPVGHSDCPSGHVTSPSLKAAGLFPIIAMAMSPFVQVPADTSQVYPDGQQFSPLEQQTAFGRGQHPHCPLDSLQHVFPVGHSDCPSGHVTSPSLKAAGLFPIIAMAMSPFVQVPADTSQVYPDGQQFSPLEQQTAFGRGQHPHCPLDSLQHVFPVGHSDCPSGHVTSPSLKAAGLFSIIAMAMSPFVQVPADRSQVYPDGQQCSPSEQQTAFGIGQHPHCPLDSLQHVFPVGHSDCPSGHVTSPSLKAAGLFPIIAMAMSPFVQVPADTSQVYPDGQQFSPLEQQTAFGRGQHPHCPLDSLQHVFPVGHSDCPSGHVTSPSLKAAGLFPIIAMAMSPFVQVPADTSQVYPDGQQFSPLEQQTAFGRGQHPHCPLDSLQHVFPVGHSDCPSGHVTSPSLKAAGLFSIIAMAMSPFVQVPADRSQVYPDGQQCSPSEQQTAFGIGQHPHCPLDSLQHVFPVGHSDCPSGHVTSPSFKAAGLFSIIAMAMSPFVQVPADRSQVYPDGQQCSPSEQQTAFGIGQHPHCPLDSLQHVFPVGHSDCPSGHVTSPSFKAAGLFSIIAMAMSPFVQVPADRSQVYPDGQQCSPSEQQTAFGIGQHPHCPLDSLQHVFPVGHSDCPSGHVTSPSLKAAGLFSIIAMAMSPFVQVPAKTSQVYPDGQQFSPLEQQTAFGRGQHPYSPLDNLQQVFPVGHWYCPPGHTTFSSLKAAGFFSIIAMAMSPFVQVPADTSQVYPDGQQFSPLEQQTAFGRGQHPHCPLDNLQQVFPAGHSDCPSGHITLPASFH